MLKKNCKILCLMLVIFMMTGCMKFQTDMKINKDKSMDFSLTYAIANSLVEQASGGASLGDETLDNESIKELEKQGFKAENFSDGSMTGVKLSKNFDNIDNVSSEKEVNFNLEAIMNGSEQTDMFTVKKGFFKNTYTLKMENNTSEEVESEMNSIDDSNAINGLEDQTTDTNTVTDNTQDIVPNESSDMTTDDSTTDNQIDFSSDIDLSMLSSSMDMTFNINLPYKAISSNATSTENDGKNLKWNLLDTNLQNINAQFELYNMNNIYLTIGIVIAIVLIIIIIIIIKKRKPKAPVGTPITVNDNQVNNTISNPEPVVPTMTETPSISVAETDNNQSLNAKVNPQQDNVNSVETLNMIATPAENNEPLNNIAQTSETTPNINQNNMNIFQNTPAPVNPIQNDTATVETLDVNTPNQTTIPQEIPTPSITPTPSVVPPVQEPEVETLDVNSEPQTPVQPSTNNTFLDEKNNIS